MGQVGQGVLWPEPARIIDFVCLDTQFPARILGGISHHQRMRERPGLAAEILDIVHAQPHFFHDLAVNGFFQVFSRLHKTSQGGVARRCIGVEWLASKIRFLSRISTIMAGEIRG